VNAEFISSGAVMEGHVGKQYLGSHSPIPTVSSHFKTQGRGDKIVKKYVS
jgi:hypothetical protein